ncbi:MAG: hypothetical protein Kow0029_31440 [Candidatus Rifleibacteriota bacterium]
MSIKPIDIKTNLMANNDASRLRETQKTHEAGLAENVAQNRNESDKKAETVQKTDATEDKVIRKEDEEEEKKGKARQKAETDKRKTEEVQEDKKKHPVIPDGMRGLKIDVKI